MNKILIIVPAYNEAKTIKSVVNQLNINIPEADILVINDCSTDETETILKKENINHISLISNLGIGGAMQTGYLYALKNDYDIAVQIDGDGQHDSYNIKEVLKPIYENEADMVIGSRYVEKTSYKTPIFRRLGMIYFKKIITLLTDKKINDTTSGYRAVNKKVIKLFANDYPNDYPEVEVLVKLNKQGFRVSEVAVEMRERKAGFSSITPIKSVYYMIKVTFNLMKRAVE
ncbi:MAG: glycosyltransferase family 2 protein [Clostridiales bacterium]|nr:glycosyltransferase family 2 protein [Clostridiales bacterium]